MRYITFWDQSDILIPCVEANRAIRSEIKARWWVLAPIPTPAVRRLNTSGIRVGKWLIVNGLAQSTRPCTFVGFEKISILRAVVGIGPDTHSGRPTSQYQWDSCGKWLIVNRLAQSTRPCTFVGFEKISILRASPAPDSAGPESGFPIVVGYKNKVTYRDRIGP